MRTTSGTAQLTRARFLRPTRRARVKAALSNGLDRTRVAVGAIVGSPIALAMLVVRGVMRWAKAIGANALRVLQACRSWLEALGHGVRTGWLAASAGSRAATERLARLPRGARAGARAWMQGRRAAREAPGTEIALPVAAVEAVRPEPAGRTRPKVEPRPVTRSVSADKTPARSRPEPPSPPSLSPLPMLKVPSVKLPSLTLPTLQLPRFGTRAATTAARVGDPKPPASPPKHAAPAAKPATASKPAAAALQPALATAASIPWLARPAQPEPAPAQPEAATSRKAWRPRAWLATLALAMDASSPARQRVLVFGTMVGIVVLLGIGSIGVARMAFGSGSGSAPNAHNRLADSLGDGPGILSFIGIVPSPSPSTSNPAPSPAPSHSTAPAAPAPSHRPQQPGPPPTPSPTPTAQQPPSVTLSTVSASPTSLVADGVAFSTVVVTLKDSTGNPVRGDHVTLTSSRGTDDMISALSAGSDNADSNGVARFKVVSTKAGAATLTARDTSVNPNVTLGQTPSLTFNPGSTSAGASTVVAAPTSVAADGSAASSVTVTIKDAFNNVIAGHTVTLVSSRGAQDAVTVVSGTTDANGRASFKVSSINAGDATLTATDNTATVALTAAAAVSFTQATSAGNSTVSVDTGTVPPDGVTTATISVMIKDFAGNPIAGHQVAVTSSAGAQDTLSAVSPTTDSSGAATFQIVSAAAGTSTITATDVTASVTVTQTATVTFA